MAIQVFVHYADETTQNDTLAISLSKIAVFKSIAHHEIATMSICENGGFNCP